MRKKMLSIILMTGLVTFPVGCGSYNEGAVTSTKVASAVTEEIKSEPVTETEGTTETVSAGEEAEASYNEYEEQKDIFMVKHIDTGDGTEIDFTNEEIIDGPFILPESIDIYSFFFTYAGYTKPDIKISSVGKVDDWIVVPFAQSSFLVKAEDFDRVAVLKEKTENTIKEDDYADTKTESASAKQEVSTAQNEGSMDTVNETAPAVETESQTEASAPAVTTYSEEEVISIVRNTLESNGIQWYPNVYPNSEAGPSGGMGWGIDNVPMSDPYTAANQIVEGFQFAGWNLYYLESQGSSNGYVSLKLYSGTN